MIINALDEVLYWEDISILKKFQSRFESEASKCISQNIIKKYNSEKDKFYEQTIPNKSEFLRRLEVYKVHGKPVWISGRNGLSDDISYKNLEKAILISSTLENGKQKAHKAECIINNGIAFWNKYSDETLYADNNVILELTVGAGLGTTTIMRRMKPKDLYIGVDIDYTCAKNADAIAKYYKVNGLGIATSLWNMPFDDNMFTAVCSNVGLEECREIPTIIKEATRVLSKNGKLVLHCLDYSKSPWCSMFLKYGFSEEEVHYWLKEIRLYSGVEEIERLAIENSLKPIRKIKDDTKGYIIVVEK